jgi:hypothetical protein
VVEEQGALLRPQLFGHLGQHARVPVQAGDHQYCHGLRMIEIEKMPWLSRWVTMS